MTTTTMKPLQLHPPQKEMVKNMSMLLILQWLIIFIIVLGMNKVSPKKVRVFFSNPWLDCLAFLVLSFGCIMVCLHHSLPWYLRFTSFLALGVLMSMVIGVTYNLEILISKDRAKTTRNLRTAWFVSIGCLFLCFLLLPVLLPYAMFFRTLQTVLMALLIVLILVGLGMMIVSKTSPRLFYIWIMAGLLLFMLFLVADVTTVVEQCQKKGTPQCDALIGSTMIYVDLVNILQKLFMVLNRHQ